MYFCMKYQRALTWDERSAHNCFNNQPIKKKGYPRGRMCSKLMRV